MRLAVVLLSFVTLAFAYGGGVFSVYALSFDPEGAQWLIFILLLGVAIVLALSVLFGAFAIWLDPAAAHVGLLIALALCVIGAGIGSGVPWLVARHSSASWLFLFIYGASAVPCAIAIYLSRAVRDKASLHVGG